MMWHSDNKYMNLKKSRDIKGLILFLTYQMFMTNFNMLRSQNING